MPKAGSLTFSLQVARYNEPHGACQEVVSESYRLWLQYETRTDDITIIAVHLDTEQHVSGGSARAVNDKK